MKIHIYALDHRKAESGGFAGAGLRQCDNISLLLQQVGDHFLLYRHGVLKSKFGDRAPERFVDP